MYSDNLEQTGGVQVPLNFSSIAFAHQNNAATIADFYILYQNINQSAEHGDVFAAVEFTLRWCVQTFSTKVVKSTAITTQHPDPSTNFTREGSFITNVVDGISFTVISQTHYSLQRYLWLLFSGATWADAANTKWVQSAEVGVIASQFGVTSDPDLDTGTQSEFIARLARIMDNVAISMTNYVRLSDVHFATGTVKVQQNFVKVDWGLIAAPVAFTVLCLLLCFGVVLSSGTQKPPIWRSGMMAGLRGLDPRLQKRLGGMMAPDMMNETSQNLFVQLSKEGDGWWLLADIDAQGTGKGLADASRSSARGFGV